MADNKKMDKGTLKAILTAERTSALASVHATKLTEQRQQAMDFYNGDMTAVMPTAVGRSEAVSTDVADVVEGLMPQLMDIFAGSDEVVRFNPTRPDDEDQAEQESDYVNHVFTQHDGFLALYSFIKDALLQKVGVVKISWCEETIERRETYYDQDDATYQILASTPDAEVIAHSVSNEENLESSTALVPIGPLHDVTLLFKEKRGYAKVEPVPPEEFGISRNARRIKDAGYTFHEVQRTEAELIDQGYDADDIRKLPSYPIYANPEELSRDTVDESIMGGDDINKSNRKIMVTEHYIVMDYEGDGKPRLYRVTTGGEHMEVLRRDKKEDIVEWDFVPFAAMTPVIMTHRFHGKSIADLVMDIQKIKTSLLRALLDNAYLANNPRTEISESHASDNTIDDLLVSRPGGVVRTKLPGGLNTLTTPPIGGHVFPLLEYMDATREWRTGVTRQGQGLDAQVLQNQSATAAAQSYSASQARAKLIARIFAETGVKDMFSLLHAVIRKYGSKAETVQLRGKWVTVNPRDWRERNDMTINVGLGNGGKSEQLQNHMVLIGAQTQALQGGLTNLVTTTNLYNSAKKLSKIIGEKNPDLYFTDPDARGPDGQLLHPPPAAPPDPKMIEIQAKAAAEQQSMQAKATLEQQKQQSDAQHQLAKTQADIALAERKAELEAQIKTLEAELHIKQVHADMGMKQHAHDHAIELASVKAGVAPPKTVASVGEDIGNRILSGMAQLHEQHSNKIMQALTAPKRVVRDQHGRVSHVETVQQG